MSQAARPRLAVTPGEPAGVGPDLVVRLAQERLPADLVVVADPHLLAERAARLGLPLRLLPSAADGEAAAPGAIRVEPVALRVPSRAGELDAANAPYVLDTLTLACDLCRDGVLDAMVTGPVHKGIINDAGLPFTGHTELIAERCAAEPVMMLAVPGLRVALATTHVPLSRVSALLTTERLESTLRILNEALIRWFRIPVPHILVCGLNPHAGEGGHLGHEDRDIIAPLIARLNADGFHLSGPLPADTAFVPERLATADAVLAMYHDQGLPVLKHLGFGRAVNLTLGLPIIRASVDHGTALDLAGTDRADLGSLRAAVAMAAELARARDA